MSPVAAPAADRRFRRAHVKPSRRRRTWQAFAMPVARYALLALVVLYAGYRASVVAAQAHVLQVDRIVVRGNERLSRDDVIALIAGFRGESLLRTDLEAWRERLLASPWIQDAALRRSLPSTVEVMVAERQPVAIGRTRGELYLVDDRGAVIDQYGPQYADLDLPIVDGLEEGDDARGELAARVIGALRAKPSVGKRLSQVDVRDVHNATIILSGDSAVIALGEDQFLPRVEAYLQLASALRDRVADIDYVDLRFDDRIYVRPAFAPSALRRGKPGIAPSALRRGKSGTAPSAHPGNPLVAPAALSRNKAATGPLRRQKTTTSRKNR
jgi:cell division protein FtsQ